MPDTRRSREVLAAGGEPPRALPQRCPAQRREQTPAGSRHLSSQCQQCLPGVERGLLEDTLQQNPECLTDLRASDTEIHELGSSDSKLTSGQRILLLADPPHGLGPRWFDALSQTPQRGQIIGGRANRGEPAADRD